MPESILIIQGAQFQEFEKKYLETNTVEDKKRVGRPRKIRTKLKMEIENEIFIAKKNISLKMIGNTKEISKTSVWNIFHKKGHLFQTAVVIPTSTEAHKFPRKIHFEE